MSDEIIKMHSDLNTISDFSNPYGMFKGNDFIIPISDMAKLINHQNERTTKALAILDRIERGETVEVLIEPTEEMIQSFRDIPDNLCNWKEQHRLNYRSMINAGKVT